MYILILYVQIFLASAFHSSSSKIFPNFRVILDLCNMLIVDIGIWDDI